MNQETLSINLAPDTLKRGLESDKYLEYIQKIDKWFINPSGAWKAELQSVVSGDEMAMREALARETTKFFFEACRWVYEQSGAEWPKVQQQIDYWNAKVIRKFYSSDSILMKSLTDLVFDNLGQYICVDKAAFTKDPALSSNSNFYRRVREESYRLNPKMIPPEKFSAIISEFAKLLSEEQE